MKELIHKDLPVLTLNSAEEFSKWLSKNFDKHEKGVWVRYFKKGSGKQTLIHDDAVTAALAWGWIDGLLNRFDEESYMVKFTPRRAKSVWSKINVAKVEKLIKEGKMKPSGMVHVEAAKADGRWDAAYAGQSEMIIPDDFIKLVKTDKEAWDFYQTLNRTNLFAIFYRLTTTVDREKREKKMQQIFERLKQKKAFH